MYVGVMVITFSGSTPRIEPSAYIQSTARIIGDVTIGAQSSVWFNAVVRGDVRHVRIGSRTNVQDNATIHVSSQRWGTVLGDDVTIGHAVVLHGCTIGNRCLIGIGAIVLDGCEIADDCMIGAGALVTPRSKFPAGSLVLGSPAKVVRPLRDEEFVELQRSAASYVEYAEHYRSQGIQ
jgi:carbonic anhydrase/acetyltransferase-like protein (isoleucine patch superfamily)